MRECKECHGDLTGKRPQAVYCSRTCKTRSSDRRRREDGRVDDRARYEREKDRRKAYARRYHVTNSEVSKAVRARRRARKRDAVSFVFTEAHWRKLKLQYRGCCAYCGGSSDDLQREHVIPLSRGGSHGAGNIVPACPSCNYSKHTSFLAVFRYKKGGSVVGYTRSAVGSPPGTGPHHRTDLA